MKKLKKLLATISASVICAVSLTPFVSNAKIGGWMYDPDQTVNPYTVSFTVNDVEKYVLWQKAFYNFDEENMKSESYTDKNGMTVTCYDGGINVYITEEPFANGNYGLYGCYYRYYKKEDGTTFSRIETGPMGFWYFRIRNEKDKETLESYLKDKNIPYKAENGGPITLQFAKGTSLHDELNVYADIKENTGVVCSFVFPTSESQQITNIEYALPEKTLDGDANEDGEVNIADATAIMQHIGNSDKYGLSMQGRANADCYNTGDGVTGMDAVAIQKFEAGLIKSLDEA